MQLRVLGFGFFQDGYVGISVLPEREEIFVGGECADAGGVCVRSLRHSCLQSIRSCHSQTRQCPCPAIPDDSAVVENLLELGGSGSALSGCQIRLAADIVWI